MNDTFPHDTSGCAASANTVRGFSGSTVGPSGSHYIIGPSQKASGPRKKEKTAMSHFWDTHHTGVSHFHIVKSLLLCHEPMDELLPSVPVRGSARWLSHLQNSLFAHSSPSADTVLFKKR